jgi:hypothetical protein
MKKNEANLPPNNGLFPQWPHDEFGGAWNYAGESLNPTPEEFPQTINKKTSGSDGTNSIDWNSPNDYHGEFL